MQFLPDGFPQRLFLDDKIVQSVDFRIRLGQGLVAPDGGIRLTSGERMQVSLGVFAGVLCYFGVVWKGRMGYDDDALDL